MNTSNAQPTNDSQQQGGIIGSYLSLITKAEVRYEGTLVDVDKENKTMTLKGVISMGTEGRRGDPSSEIPPSEQVLGMAKFKIDLVKSFNLIEKKQEEDKNIDPAILESHPEEQKKQQYKQRNGKNDDWAKGTKVVKGFEQLQSDESTDQNKFKNERSDFNFETREIAKKIEKDEEGEDESQTKPKYDKNTDFFDQITNSTLEPRPRGRGGRGRGGDYRGGGNNYRGRGDYANNFRGRGDDNYRARGNFGNSYRGRGEADYRDRGNFHRENTEESLKNDQKPEDSLDLQRPLRGHRGGYEGGFKPRDSNQGDYRPGTAQPYKARGGYEGAEGGQRGGYRGNRGRGGEWRQMQSQKRDEETFGELSAQNFKFSHKQGEIKKKEAVKQEDKRGMGFYNASKDPVVEDGHNDFFDKKKNKQ